LLKSLLPLLFLLFLLPAHAKKRFEWTPALREAYNKTLSLRFKDAASDLVKIRQTDPDNLLILHVENYLDFFHVYINEEESEFKRLEKNKDKRLETIEKEGDKSSPYYLFLQADIRLHWALARLKFEEYSTAFFETNKAFKLLTANAEKFPMFMPNKKDLGILHAIVGTIPDNFKWTVSWLSSMEGSMEQGKGELEEVLRFAQKQDFIYEDEIYVYYAYLMLHLENDSEEAWKIINKAKLNPKENPLACFVMANIAMRTDRGDDAINILLERPTGKQFHPFHYLDYMLGLVKLQRLDKDADTYLQRYVDNYKGRNFIKDAYQKLAWHSLLHGNAAGYKDFMNRCKSRGYTIVGSDKSALADAKSGDVPAIELLKARVLFDGGRFQRAYDVLKAKKPDDYLSEKNRLEYNYRMGRITHKLGRVNEALIFYQKTIDQGQNSLYYFACRSALEKGHILEELKRNKQARNAYNQCLSMSPADHKTGLHQQAKAGLRRLK
jgi:tetratricopeptide (TPR) repeat protein